MHLKCAVNPRKVTLILGFFAVLLAVQSLFAEYLLAAYVGISSDSLLASMLDLLSVNIESSIPTWYATMILVIAATLLTVIAVARRAAKEPQAVYWTGLALIFLYLSLDEGAAIHEIFSAPVQAALNTSGYLEFGWLVVGVPLFILFGLVYGRFVMALPSQTRNLFALAAVLYAGGAILVEAISANQWSSSGGPDLVYLGIATIEECLEMLGVVVFIYALLLYLVDQGYALTLEPSAALQKAQPVAAGDVKAAARLADRESWQPRRWLLIITVPVLALNLLLFLVASAQEPVPAASPRISPAMYEAITDRLALDGVMVTRLTGTFNPENPAAHRVVNSLLDVFDEVMVVSLPAAETSLAIAGDTLPFDQNALAEILHASGETRFIVFDAPTVRLIAGGD